MHFCVMFLFFSFPFFPPKRWYRPIHRPHLFIHTRTHTHVQRLTIQPRKEHNCTDSKAQHTNNLQLVFVRRLLASWRNHIYFVTWLVNALKLDFMLAFILIHLLVFFFFILARGIKKKKTQRTIKTYPLSPIKPLNRTKRGNLFIFFWLKLSPLAWSFGVYILNNASFHNYIGYIDFLNRILGKIVTLIRSVCKISRGYDKTTLNIAQWL